MSEPKQDNQIGYALVELFGHQKIVGMVSETTLAGGAFLRVDVPGFNHDPAFTRFYSPGSIYSISPIGEVEARALMAQYRHEPVSRWELPQLAEKVTDPETLGDNYCQGCRELEENCTCPEREE